MNDGACDPTDGSTAAPWPTTASQAGRPCIASTLTGRSVVVLEGATISNGLDWSPDNTLAYYVDTPTCASTCSTTSRATGLTNRRVFASIDEATAGRMG